MKKLFLSSVLLCCTLPFFAQKTISGRVIEEASGEALAYVSIGIPGTSIGTVAGEDGRFTLEIPEKNLNSGKDSLQFSLLGFTRKSVALSTWKEEVVDVVLKPSTLQLREVVVTPDNTKLRVLGKEKKKYRMVVNYALEGKINQNLGSEIGRRFKIEKASRLEKFQFYVAANNFDTVRFRINVYDLEGDEPGASLLQEQIITTLTGKQTGWVTVDLQPYDLVATERLAVGVEWIYGSKGGTMLTLPIAMPVAGSKHYYKYGSRNKWKSFAGMSAAMFLEVRQ
ncbi:MAG: carboxypeptidase-like regulatory domain-containing protein [Saprospiraceae bacterium]|nr:carboxypeptidase-like regulatory domain-containing protein [Saprospiraceae bacterium]